MRSAKSPAILNPWVRRYLDHLGLERRYSPNTVAAAARDLALIPAPQESATAVVLKTLLAQRHAEGLAPKTLARIASSWRGFFRYLVEQGAIQLNPAEALKTPKPKRSLPKALGVDQAAGLLEGQVSEEFAMQQVQTLIRLLYATGLRISEALALRVGASQQAVNSTLDLTHRELRVVGKGSKTRVVPLIVPVCHDLIEHLKRRETQLQTIGVVNAEGFWLSARGKPLSARQAQMDVARYARLKGLSQHLHPHMLRHSFGSHVLQSTQNLRAVQELLGHASLASTQVYTALDFSHLAQVYDSAFPRAK